MIGGQMRPMVTASRGAACTTRPRPTTRKKTCRRSSGRAFPSSSRSWPTSPITRAIRSLELLAVEERDFLLDQVPDEPLADRLDDVARRLAVVEEEQPDGDALDDQDADHHGRERAHHLDVAAHDAVVDDHADDLRIGQRGADAEQHEERADHEEPPLLPKLGGQPSEEASQR